MDASNASVSRDSRLRVIQKRLVAASEALPVDVRTKFVCMIVGLLFVAKLSMWLATSLFIGVTLVILSVFDHARSARRAVEAADRILVPMQQAREPTTSIQHGRVTPTQEPIKDT